MNAAVREALRGQVLAMADDEFVLAHRNSEWTGHGPILEEDIAFTNIALDEMGHAVIWYTLLAALSGEEPETHPDRLVFFRDPEDYRNTQFVELPKRDWAFSMLRQYLFDAAERVRLERLIRSAHPDVAAAAAKIQREEIYHYRHTQAWVRRLGLGTEESHQRMQQALEELWAYALQLFAPLPAERVLVEAGVVPDPVAVRGAWEETVRGHLQGSGLCVPSAATPAAIGRDHHTEHLPALVKELQVVARADPEAVW